jgi:uncharacterized membrane protein YphA (DoxX/SURF4 family)
MRTELGRWVYGAAAIAFGVITLVWREFSVWQQNVPHWQALIYLLAAVEILGGLAILWKQTARAGAVTLGCLYFYFALTWVPRIAAQPGVFDRWGNFFEQFSIVCGALIGFAMLSAGDSRRARVAARIGYCGFGICVISFTLEQALYLQATASFVPKWIPPGQMFWAVATTAAFAAAALALLTGRMALLASRLLTAMIAGFGLLVWLPAPFAAPHQLTSWAGNAQNTAILGAAWMLTDYLSRRKASAMDAA